MSQPVEPRFLATALLVWALGAQPHGAIRQAPAQTVPTRAPAALVWVAVTAMDRDGRLAPNLGRADFEVTEDGVVQPVVEFRSHDVPFALTIMFDRSGSLWSSIGAMRMAMSALIDGFQPGDRANVGWFDTLPSVGPRFSSHRATLMRSIVAATSAVAVPCRGPWMTRSNRRWAPGASGIWDAVACGIDTVASDAETPRRVVLVITDGVDNVSVMKQPEVQALADTYGVMVYAVAIRGIEGLNTTALRTLATETGGGYFNLNQGDDLAPVMTRIAEELRHQYVIGYAPVGPAPRGKLEVRAKHPDVTVKARRATMTMLPVAAAVTESVAAERARVTAAVAATLPAVPVMAAETVFDRSARDALRAEDLPTLLLRDLQAAAQIIRTSGPEWVTAKGPALEPIRRLQLVTFILDFLSVQDFVPYWHNHAAAADLFEWASSQLRTGAPQPAERTWYLAGIALLQRFGAVDTLERHLVFARDRFPDEPRFLLAHALAAEMRVWPHARDTGPLEVSGLMEILSRYAAACEVPSIQQEARIRLGFFELLRGRHAEALKHFDLAREPDDGILRYLLHLFRGKALMAAQQPARAIVSFGLALETVPYAQSATLALAAALVTQGRQNEAEALTHRMLAVQPAPFDPWTIYTILEGRHWPGRMAELRKAGGS